MRIINISSGFVYDKYKTQYKLPESISTHYLFALELKQVPKLIVDNLFNKKIFPGLYLKNDSFLYISNLPDIFNMANKVMEIDELFGKYILYCLKNFTEYDKNHFIVGTKIYSSGNPCIMGIVNVTPDSFSDGGKYYDRQQAINHALNLLNDGADFIDIGGESTRPGSEPVNINEEFERVIPVIEGVLEKSPDAVLSIDTTKAKVAYEAVKKGVKIVNDISGLTFDPEMIDVVKELNVSLVIMHIKGTPKDMQVNPHYDDVVSEVFDFIEEKINTAKEKGITSIIIDPGIGFGKTMKDNYELLQRLNEFKSLGYPILVGVSKKSFLGKKLNLDINSREVPSVIAETYSMLNGAKIIRTHNVKNAVQAKILLKCFSNPGLML